MRETRIMQHSLEIPLKPVGKLYRIVFRSANFSYGKIAVMGAVAGTGHFPVVSFKKMCVCCNQSTEECVQVKPTDPGGHFSADPLNIPVCSKCKEHALSSTEGEAFAGIGFVTALALVGLGWMYKSWALAGAGGFFITIILFWLIKEKKRLREVEPEHFPGFSLMVAPNQLVVGTPNRNLVEYLVQNHSELVFKIH